MARRKKTQILDKEFETQKELKEYVQKILYAYELNELLSPEHFQFIRSLLNNHPDSYEKIGDGIESIWIQENVVNRGKSRGFWFQRIDRSIDNFSYKVCIESPPSVTSHFLMACREAADSYVNAYREKTFQGVEILQCHTTGDSITLKESYVAHSPLHFKELAEAFRKNEDLVLSEQLFQVHRDGDFAMSFADEALRQKWIKYHSENATLEIRSKSVLGVKV
ncbi:hypothetical protein DP113_03200 [Brasilonema octagenarum UFV-E1]|uniref:DUF3223 domain-containing protein n=1 Tax=Brasilonema sennae CENA114 TaxID=415709 RepID=A0A856MDE7_9CYAN|nr:DCL family protein [Brasilonema sennae]QDL07057.1 hypothetical protein DP114_03245 [Brasilonema sennae CENA114]QDL13420.1 hypothetical protein DP113_03200 [Brasilonema octagenarum UFV-E1]